MNRAHRPPSTMLIPLGVFVALASGVVWLWQQANSRQGRALARDTQLLVEQTALRLEEVGRNAEGVALQMLSSWQAGDRSGSGFTLRASASSARHPELLAINWVNASGIIERVYPENEVNLRALDRDLTLNEGAARYLEESRGTDEVVFTPPRPLYQGSAGMATYLRLDEGGSDGFINVVFSLDGLIARLGDSVLEEFDCALCYLGGEGATGRLCYGPDGLGDSSLLSRPLQRAWPFQLGSRPWELILAPKQGRVLTGASWQEHTFLGVGLALALALAVVVRRELLSSAALARSEHRYRSVVRDLPDLICRYRLDGTITFVNDAFAEHFEHSVASLMGSSLFDLYPEQRRDELHAQIAALDPEQPRESMRHSAPHGPDGPQRWERWRERALLDEDGRPVEVQSIGHDDTDAHEAQERLRHSQERYRTLVESSPDGVLIHREGRILYANDSVARLVGASGTWQLAGMPVEDLVRREDRAMLREPTVTRGGAPARVYDARFKHQHGHLVDVEVIGTRVVFDGQPAVQAILRDVTERRRAERALRDSEERFRAIFGSISDGVLIHDRNGALLEVNESACALFGQQREVMLRLDIGALVADDDHRTVSDLRSRFAAARASGEPQLFGFRARRANAAYWWAEVSLRAARIGGRERVLAAVRDVTERREAQEALSAARNRLDHLLSTGPTVIYSRSPAPFSELTFVSRNVAQLIGRGPEALLGERSRWRAILAEADRVRVDAELAEADARGDRFSSEYRLVTADGAELWVQDDARLLEDERGKPVEWVGCWRDVSKRKRIEQRQRLMMDELDQRVKNTLATVLSLLEQTLAGTSSSAELRDAFRGRVEALARAHDALARDQWESVDLERISHLVLGPQVQLGRIRVAGPALPLDSRMASPLALALHELAINAAKHGALSMTTGHVDLTWSEEERGLVLRWIESGGPTTRPPTSGGTGLRLVRGLVEHEVGGKVSFEFDQGGLQVELVVPTTGSVPRAQLLV